MAMKEQREGLPQRPRTKKRRQVVGFNNERGISQEEGWQRGGERLRRIGFSDSCFL